MAPRATLRSLWLVGVVASFTVSAGGVDAARILGIFPTPSISHQLPFQAIMKTLVARGHHVTVIGTDPLKEPMQNYTDIDLSFSYDTLRKIFSLADVEHHSAVGFISQISMKMTGLVDEQLSSPQMQAFLKTNPQFDLVLLEWLWFQAYFGVYHRVGSPPLIGALSVGGAFNSHNAIGNPTNPAWNPEPIAPHSDRMTFLQRVYNTFVHLWTMYHWHWNVMPAQEALMRKHFGNAPPPVADTEKNMSLLVLHNHWSTEYVRPLLPSTVQITGNHVKDNPAPLPQDLQQWMDEAKDGVIYFSLGSNVMSKDLPLEKRSAILNTFSRLPQRVLWKFENDDLPGRPDNVRISKWLPQQSILAHPNLRLFITQGGLQSFHEATFHAVPLLGIPFIGDQPYNVEKMVSSGVGKRLELKDLTEESFYETITSILEDESYKESMIRLSAVFREHKASSMENAVWWIEYVLRHNGAPHLRSAALDLTWYQYLLLDVLAVALVARVILLYVVYVLFRYAKRKLRGNRNQEADSKVKTQ